MRETIGAGISVVGCFFIVIVLIVVSSVGVWLGKVYFAEEIGRGNAEIQIQSAPNRISAHRYFYDLCVSVQNAEASLDAQTRQLEQTTDEASRNRIMTNIASLHTTRQSGINMYNADSADYTAGQFKASDLPYSLSTAPYTPSADGEGSPRTQCTARG